MWRKCFGFMSKKMTGIWHWHKNESRLNSSHFCFIKLRTESGIFIGTISLASLHFVQKIFFTKNLSLINISRFCFMLLLLFLFFVVSKQYDVKLYKKWFYFYQKYNCFFTILFYFVSKIQTELFFSGEGLKLKRSGWRSTRADWPSVVTAFLTWPITARSSVVTGQSQRAAERNKKI